MSHPAPNLPPQNIEAEESVLGAMMIAEQTLSRVIDDVGLVTSDFYGDRHRVIYEVIASLYRTSKPVDELSVSEALAQRNKIGMAGGRGYVARLVAKVPRGRQRQALRGDRDAEFAPAPASRRGPRDPKLGEQSVRNPDLASSVRGRAV